MIAFFLKYCGIGLVLLSAIYSCNQNTEASGKPKPLPPSLEDTLFHRQVTDAIFTGKIDYNMLDTLLAQGADINTFLVENEQRMKLSAHLPIIKRFVDKPYYTVVTKNTPLMAVCFSVDRWGYDEHLYDLTKYLLEHGANIYYKNPDRDGLISPLEYIIERSSFAYGAGDSEKNVEYYLNVFMDNGFDISRLDVSRYEGEWELISYLTQKGVPKKINFGNALNPKYNDYSWKKLLKDKTDEFQEGWEFDFEEINISDLTRMEENEIIRLWDVARYPRF